MIDEDIELLASVTFDTADDLNAVPDDFAPSALKRVVIKKSKLRQQMEQMATTASSLMEGWSIPHVRLDEVSFTLQTGTDGLLKWVLGVGVSGAATLKFKIDPPPASKNETAETTKT